MKRPSRPRAVAASVAIVLSALVLPVVTNVMSNQLPTAWSRYAWLSIPLAAMLTVCLIALSNRSTDRSAAVEPAVQINVAQGVGSTIYAAQHGDVRSPVDRAYRAEDGR